jgi:hypothetical protein
MSYSRYFILFILFLNTLACYAQKDSSNHAKYTDLDTLEYSKEEHGKQKQVIIKNRRADTLFIRQYPEFITLGLFTATPYMTIGMEPLNDSISKYASTFEGNYSAALGFSFGYRALGFSYGVRLPLDPIDEGQMGKSSFRIFNVKIKKLPFIINLTYRRYNGFYDTNTKSYDSTTTEEKPYSIRPDLTFRTYSGSMICNLSWRRYSYSAPINYADRQIKTRIGFLMKGAVSYMQLFSDTSFISNYQIAYFPDFYKVKSIDAIVFKYGPGVGMNLIFFKRMYLSINLFLMSNSLVYRYTQEDTHRTGWKYNVNYFLEGAVALGYNSKRFYMGFRVGGDNNVMRIQGAQIQTNFGSVSLDMGFRLNAPEFFRKAWNRTLTRYLRL